MARSHEGYAGITRGVQMHVDQQSYHADEAGNGKDVDRRRRLFADVDLLMRDVI